jgi:hypothetical protein
MFALLCLILAVLASPFQSKIRLEAENAALRHQLIVLRRKMPGRTRLRNFDRLFFIQLYRWFPVDLAGDCDYPTRNPRALASGRLSLLLAVEVAFAGRAAAD